MGLSSELISRFVKLTNDRNSTNVTNTMYGSIVDDGQNKYVRLDGSEVLTPINLTATVKADDRVLVRIENHTATVVGNLTSPSARNDDLIESNQRITEVEVLVADSVTTDMLTTEVARINVLLAGTISTETFTAEVAAIEELLASKATIDSLTATNAEIETLKANTITAAVIEATYAKIANLEATNLKVNNLEATYGDFTVLTAENFKAVNANIENLQTSKLSAYDASITYATIASLAATDANIASLKANVADIDTLIFGSATGDVIQTSFANAVIAQLGNAQIKSAMIESVSAGKITAGDIITNNVCVKSEDGSLLISDETIQIKDLTRVRVQIGKDASNDYSINIWDADGNLMFSKGGITDSAIKNAIIRNDMVSETANISASKLDIDSLFTEINGSSNTIKSTKVYLDDKGQTLDVAFTSMTTEVGGLSNTVKSQGTQISTIQGQITSKIWQQDITAATGVLSTQYSTLEQELNGFKTTVSSTYATGAELAALSTQYSTLKQDLNGFKTTVSSTYATGAELGVLSTQYSTLKQDLNGFKTTVSSTYATGTELTDLSTTFEQTASGLTTKINSIEVGGRNLISGTSETEIALGGYPTTNHSEGKTGKTINIPSKNEYVLSFDAKSTVNGDKIRCFFYSPNTTTKVETSTGYTGTSADGNAEVQLTTTWTRYWIKYTQNGAGTTSVKNWIVGRRLAGLGTGSVSIRGIKLEEGNKPSSWSPAPEDVTTSINNAGKTATNYLNFSTAGLVVGDMTATTLGKNVLIDSDSVDIRNGTTTLASFGATTIDLGVTGESATINFCGEAGTILYRQPSDIYGGNQNRFTIRGHRPYIIGHGGTTITLLSQSTSTDFGIVDVTGDSVYLKAQKATYMSDAGYYMFTGTEVEVSRSRFYTLSDSVELVGRDGVTIQTVSGTVDVINSSLRTSERIRAEGGLRLTNGGQITGLTSDKTEITMIQMNASNYTMFGYGGYLNKIGRTYLDGNAVYIRSNADINMTGNTTIYGSLELYKSSPYIDFHFGSSEADYTSRIIENATGDLRILASADIILQIENASTKAMVERVGLYSSTNSAYSAFFRPHNDAKCTLGIASNRWYAVYANNATIQTSDRREKENIVPLGANPVMMLSLDEEPTQYDIHSELFDRLQPVQYNFIDGNGRVCFGLIAQDVLDAMNELGIGEDELDLVHHEFWPDEETGEEKETFGLAYANLIAMLIHEVQKLKIKIKSLKTS